MRKNLLLLVIFALVLVNLVLTAVMAVTIVPEIGQVNSLISKVGEAIDLDTVASNENAESSSIDLTTADPVNLSDTMTINLKSEPGDDSEHFAVLGITLMENKNSEAYATYGGAENLTTYESTIKGTINSVIMGHTIDDMRNDTQNVLNEIKDELNALFDSPDFISQVLFSSATYQ